MTAEEYYKKVKEIDAKVFDSMCDYQLFTIKYIQSIIEDLNDYIYLDHAPRLEKLVERVCHRTDCILDICDPSLPDYKIFKEIYNIFYKDGDNV